MGKRKLHGTSYYQCDWTGLPMSAPNCYMPHWNDDGKLVKKGTYCNWESVLAHAKEVAARCNIDCIKIEAYVRAQMHGSTTEAPHYSELEHFKGEMSPLQYHKRCCYETGEVWAVKIHTNGDYGEFLVDSINGEYNFGQEPLIISRKGKRDVDLLVTNSAGSELNALASNLFKTKIHGDVILVQRTKEQSFLPRTRYVNYMQADFVHDFMIKRKKFEEKQCLDACDYKALKQEMQTSLSDYEKQASSSAVAVPEVVKLRKMVPTNGKRLARLVQHEKAQKTSSQ